VEDRRVGEDTHFVVAPAREAVTVVGASAGGLAGAVAAAFASACCIGPSTVALLGAGGAVAAAGLQPHRSGLLGISLLLLAFGFWRAYGRRVVVAGRACPVRVGRFARMSLWISALMWVVAAALPRR
jgi:MerT mercuric transport protein